MQKPISISDDMRSRLMTAAQQARQKAYVPYSHYMVGAALLTSNGEVFLGCNIENATYSPTVCAERVAVFKAVSEGFQNFDAIVVATSNGGTPCGVCRQVLNEFAPDMLVIVINADNRVTFEGPLTALLPYGFGSEQLQDHATS